MKKIIFGCVLAGMLCTFSAYGAIIGDSCSANAKNCPGLDCSQYGGKPCCGFDYKCHCCIQNCYADEKPSKESLKCAVEPKCGGSVWYCPTKYEVTT